MGSEGDWDIGVARSVAEGAIIQLHDQAEARVADLIRELEAIVGQASDTAPDDEHDAEGSTIGYERARISALLDHARKVVGALDEAGDLIKLGTYGRCVECGRQIPPERLAAVPATIHCLSCQVNYERGATNRIKRREP
jgi:RNA polymerase-binding transcription factor DksA